MPQHETWVAWSDEDLSYLKKYAGHHKKQTIASRMGRSLGAVEQMASKLGLSLAFRQSWRKVTNHEVSQAKSIVTNHTSKSSAARAMGISRSRFIYLISRDL